MDITFDLLTPAMLAPGDLSTLHELVAQGVRFDTGQPTNLVSSGKIEWALGLNTTVAARQGRHIVGVVSVAISPSLFNPPTATIVDWIILREFLATDIVIDMIETLTRQLRTIRGIDHLFLPIPNAPSDPHSEHKRRAGFIPRRGQNYYTRSVRP